MKRFTRILCVLEGREPCMSTLDRAASLAANNQARLTVAVVVPRLTAGIGLPDSGPISSDLQAALVAEQERLLNSLVEPLSKRQPVATRVLVGTPFLEVIREVLRNGHDLVIKTPEDPSWLERLFGSDDMHLLRKCPCPLWLTKCAQQQGYRRVLAAVDVDTAHPAGEMLQRQQMNHQILELACSIALSEFAELHVVHAWEAIGESAMLGAFLNRPRQEVADYVEQVRQLRQASLDDLMNEVVGMLGEDALKYLEPKQHLLKGPARKRIPDLMDELGIDLVVMGTVARTGVPGFIIGNTAETILDQIDCSVLAVKPPGFVTPVSLDD